MPETPDFPTIALRVITDLEAITGTTAPDPAALPLSEIQAVNAQTRQMMAVVAEQLRLIWNARGAADIATIDHALAPTMGSHAKLLSHALRSLDR